MISVVGFGCSPENMFLEINISEKERNEKGDAHREMLEICLTTSSSLSIGDEYFAELNISTDHMIKR